MPEPIILNFTYTRTDYIQAMRQYYRSIFHVRLDISIAILGIAIGCYLLYSQGSSVSGLFAIVASLIFLAIFFLCWVVLPRISFKRQPKLKEPHEWSFSDEGITFRTTGINSKLDWSIFIKWLVGDDIYLLYYSKRSMIIIPRRAFSNDLIDRAFVELLIRKIGNHAISHSRC